MNRKVKMGIIGLGQRGYVLLHTILACEEAEIVALCDTYADRLEENCGIVLKKSGKRPVGYADYHDLVNDENVEAVLICSSWDEHVPMAVECMRKGKITALEVGGAYDIESCWELVRAYEETQTPFMMMENCCWDKFELLSTSLAKAGKLGEIVHCHGAYSHDLRDEILGGIVNRHYRLTNYQKRNCENYPTHELGPIAKILGINRGNKMLTLSSVASKAAGLADFSKGEKNPDKSLIGMQFTHGDIISTNIVCAGGETITMTLDTTLPKYYSREFTVRGTKGLCNQESNMVFLDETHDSHEFYEPQKTIRKYLDNAEEYSDYLPDIWKNITDKELELGHGGMDYLEFKAFFKAILNGEEMPIDVYDAAAWMAITPLSELSIAQGGAIQAIPDFTRGQWLYRPIKDVTQFPKILDKNKESTNPFGNSRG
jgi:predicted dehydrogenase